MVWTECSLEGLKKTSEFIYNVCIDMYNNSSSK